MATPNGYNPQFEGAIRTGSVLAASAAGTTAALLNFSSTSGLGLYFGTGAPGIVAAQGSLYINTSGSTSTTILYVNTGGSTVWLGVGAL